eukprot:3050983-Rhodomonas_salina.1
MRDVTRFDAFLPPRGLRESYDAFVSYRCVLVPASVPALSGLVLVLNGTWRCRWGQFDSELAEG